MCELFIQGIESGEYSYLETLDIKARLLKLAETHTTQLTDCSLHAEHYL